MEAFTTTTTTRAGGCTFKHCIPVPLLMTPALKVFDDSQEMPSQEAFKNH